MHTPAGFEIIDGRFFPKDWFEIVFNPSFPYRLAHTVSAFYVTTAFVVLAVGAYTVRRGQRRRRRPHDAAARDVVSRSSSCRCKFSSATRMV